MDEIDLKGHSQQATIAPYGYCERCSAAIEIPGLDGSRCPNCGWIDCLKVVLALPKPQTAKAESRPQVPATPLPELTRSKPSSQPETAAPSQISLLAGGSYENQI